MAMTETEQSLLDSFKLDAEHDWDIQEDQRDRADEDSRFVTVPGAQWENFLEEVFGDDERPRFQYDKLSGAVKRFTAEWTMNRATVSFRPDDGRKSEREADLLDGLWRRDIRRNDGQEAIDNAVEEAARCGFGAFRIATDWLDEEKKHQKIYVDPIYGAATCVLWDSNARRKNKCDATRCTLIHEYSRDSFKRKYPKAQESSVYHSDRRDSDFAWATRDSVFVAERYWVEEKVEKACKYINPVSMQEELYWLEDIELVLDEMDAMGFLKVEDLEIERRRVYKRLYNGVEFLTKKQEVPGRYIPIIPVYAYWAYVDGMERYAGIVTFLKDPQRLFNLQVSRMAETAASSPRETPIFAPEQVNDSKGIIKALLERAQHKDLPYVLLNPLKDSQGNIIHSGPLDYLRRPTMDQNSAGLLELTGNFLQQETGGAPQDVLDPDGSGKAILAQAARIDLNTQPIMDSVKSALRHAGEVYRWIASDVYSEPRTVTALGIDGGEYEARLFDTVMDQETGRPVQVNDLTRGRFEVVVDTGPGYQSKRQETVANLKDILQGVSGNPETAQYVPVLMAMLIENIDGVGLEPLKKYNSRIMLQMGLREPEDEEEEAMLAQMQQAAANQPPSPTDLLMQATAKKESAQGDNYLADAALKQTEAMRNMADARLKEAQTVDELA